MSRDPFHQPASSGAFNSTNFNDSTTLSQRPSQAQLSSSSSHSASSMSRASTRNSPTAFATAQFPPPSFATSNPTTTALAPAPVSTAAMTASTTKPFPSMFANMASPHPASIAHQPESVLATAKTSFDTGRGIIVLVRGLDAAVTETSLHYMFMAFNDRLVSYRLLEHLENIPAQQSNPGKQTRMVYVLAQSSEVALELKDKFHEKNGLAVEIMGPPSSGPSSNGTSPTTTPAVNVSQGPRFGVYSSNEASPVPIGNSLRNGNGNGHAFSSHNSPFSPQSPIDISLKSQPRVSGKSLINDSTDDDDITQDILMRLPREYQAENVSTANSRAPGDHYYIAHGHVAYVANGMTSMQRRATAPQLPIAANLASLSLNTGSNGMPAAQHSMYPQSAHSRTMSPSNMAGLNGYPNHYSYSARPKDRIPPAANPADQNPPCNTLYVGNLPMDAKEDELRAIFSTARGYKRMCFRTKPNGPMCFVEFEDTTTASRAMESLYGILLAGSKRGGIRLSFSKNPLGVRSSQPGPPGPPGSHHGMMGHGTNGFSAPPPGLNPCPQPPPGLGPNRSVSSYGVPPGMTNGAMTNGTMTNGVGIGAVNGSNLTDGTAYAAQGTNGNGNNALGIGLGNGTNFDQRSEQRATPWAPPYSSILPNPYNATPYQSPYTMAPAGGSNSQGPYGYGPRQGSS